MVDADKGRRLYDRYLDELAAHINAAAALRAIELQQLTRYDDSASYIAERATLKRVEREALERYMDARKAYEDYRRARVDTDQ